VLSVSSVLLDAAAAPAAAPTTAGGTPDVVVVVSAIVVDGPVVVTVCVVVCVCVLVFVVVTTAVEVTGGDVTVSLTVVAVDAGRVGDVWTGLVGAVAVVVGSVGAVVVGVDLVGSVRVPVPVGVEIVGRWPPPPQAESRKTEKNPRIAAEPSRQAFAACDARMPDTLPALPAVLARPVLCLRALERCDTTLDAHDLTLGAHAAPAERSRHAELAVELLKLPTCGIELGVGRRIHGRSLYAARSSGSPVRGPQPGLDGSSAFPPFV
jgi:hypothetical protein